MRSSAAARAGQQARQRQAASTLEVLGEEACLALMIVIPLSPELDDARGSGQREGAVSWEFEGGNSLNQSLIRSPR